MATPRSRGFFAGASGFFKAGRSDGITGGVAGWVLEKPKIEMKWKYYPDTFDEE
ncbi:Hypothetical protein Minf_0875 [Methylacidiphilum infernorum V4]|uniref:Uncharacterized protein n=1 Tax=Methylacidiphilum infernorum (isolate V4) TaxID=481448 RepID=B3E1D4_METI4|nr:Hypothetical protein Minf_0875 [Methylacidiphilum infernorum V4]